MIMRGPPVYGLLMLAGILLTAWIWSRASRIGASGGGGGGGGGGGHDRRLTLIYFAGLGGALLGAKLAFLLAEGWHFRGDWMALLSGRSITGGLLGGYAAVEVAKRVLGERRATGDLFAILVPLALALGRVGCLIAGCCPGVPCEPAWWTIADAHGVHRWPAVPAELLFNLAMLAWAALATFRGWLRGNLFHVYLMAYGLFRFGHEFLRDDTRWVGALGGYHVLALAIAALGATRFASRRWAMLAGRTAALALTPRAG
jgi:phosphatidylglycerol:prolipoprotein diacylglycerol transferase